MSQPQPSTLQVGDAVSDALARASSVLEEINERLGRIARAVEALQQTGSD